MIQASVFSLMLEAGLARRAVLAGPLVAALAATMRSEAVAESLPALAARSLPARQLPVPDTVSPGPWPSAAPGPSPADSRPR